MMTLRSRLKRWCVPAFVTIATCFGVFVLPFFFPPALIQGVSVANIAGFNNKVAAIAAATIGIAVFVLALRKNWFDQKELTSGDFRPLSSRVITLTVVIYFLLTAGFSKLIVDSHYRFLYDAYYFIHQISMHADYGRKLYDEIEFPYGPFLFYGPILVRSALSIVHLSLAGAYFITFVVEAAIGIALLAWTINHLPILYRWKKLLWFLVILYAVQPNFGLNYTFFRFATAAAGVVLISRQTTRGRFATAVFFVQIVCLGISPEMGFAFFAAATAYALWKVYSEGRSWLICIASAFVATGLFLFLAGGGYLRMLALFSHGVFNFIVEPLPHTLLFLFAFIWLIPPMLAMFFRQHRPEAPMMAALYVLCLALLPVAFGRADPGHVFFNQIPIYLLSMVAIAYRTRWRQNLWAICVVIVILLPFLSLPSSGFLLQLKIVIRHRLFGPHPGIAGDGAAFVLNRYAPAALKRQYADEQRVNAPFDVAKLQQIVGTDRVATPYEVPLKIEEALRRFDQFTPSIYCFKMDIFDRSAEVSQINDFNTSKWALLPKGMGFSIYEDHRSSVVPLGFALPYREKHPPYVVGKLFKDNLATNWRPYAEMDGYIIYKRN